MYSCEDSISIVPGGDWSVIFPLSFDPFYLGGGVCCYGHVASAFTGDDSTKVIPLCIFLVGYV